MGSTDPESPRLWDMVEKHYTELFSFGESDAFWRASVYVRKEDSPVGEVGKEGNNEGAEE